jgi:hypothetical protein
VILSENSDISEDFIHRLTNQDTNTERFMFSDFKQDEHCICVWDEFRLPRSVKAFKQIIGGETLATDVKNKESIKMIFPVPIIMISNTNFSRLLKECAGERGIAERLLAIEANSEPFDVRRKVDIEEKISKLDQQ